MDRPAFPIVGVGAPAAGIDALEGFFRGEGASDAEGRIELGRFAPGNYTLEASRGLQRGVDPEVVLKAGADEVELRIELR